MGMTGTPPPPTDKAVPVLDHEPALLNRARGGEQAAYEALYRAHAPRIHALCWRIGGGDRQLAEELTQDVFVKAWRKLDTFRGDASLGTWLHRLAVNEALSDRRKRSRRLQPVALEEGCDVGTGAPEMPWPGCDRDLETAIAQLPDRARAVLVLAAIEGYSHREVGAMTGMSEGSSKAQLHRARTLLMEWLQE